MLEKFLPFAQQRMGFKVVPHIHFENDEANAQNPLGKTAYYEPARSSITIYTVGRHPKDIMRSISHELVHHAQNGRGEFANSMTVGEQGYAQNDDHLREMEREAYEKGNLCFRDWEDSIKTQNEELNMFEKRNKRLNESVMKKFGYKTTMTESDDWYSDKYETFADEKFAHSQADEEGGSRLDRASYADVTLERLGFIPEEITRILWIVMLFVKDGDEERAFETLESQDEASIKLLDKMRGVFAEDCPGDDEVVNCIMNVLVTEFGNRPYEKTIDEDLGVARPIMAAFDIDEDATLLMLRVMQAHKSGYEDKAAEMVEAEAVINDALQNRYHECGFGEPEAVDCMVRELVAEFGNVPMARMTFDEEPAVESPLEEGDIEHANPMEDVIRYIADLEPTTLNRDKRMMGEDEISPLAAKTIVGVLDNQSVPQEEKDNMLRLSIKEMISTAFNLESQHKNVEVPVDENTLSEEERSEEEWDKLDQMQSEYPDMTIPEIEAMISDDTEEPIAGSGGEEYEVGDTIKDEENRTGEVLELTAYGAIAQFEGGAGPEKIRFKHMTKVAGDKELARPEEGDVLGLSEEGDFNFDSVDVDLAFLEEEFPDAFEDGIDENDIEGGCGSEAIQIVVGQEDVDEDVVVMTQEVDEYEKEDPHELRGSRLHEKLTKWSIK